MRAWIKERDCRGAQTTRVRNVNSCKGSGASRAQRACWQQAVCKHLHLANGPLRPAMTDFAAWIEW